MHRQFLIIIFIVFRINCLCQLDSSLNRIEPKGTGLIDKSSTTEYRKDTINFNPIGKINDFIICDKLGLTILAGSETPNFGLSIDYNPLFLKKIIGQIGYRSDFRDNYIFNTSIESKFLINKYQLHLDFKLSYENFEIINSFLKDFHKLSIGPIYRFPWTSYGFFFGQDSFEKQIGFDFYGKYQFHQRITGSDNEYKSKIIIQSLIGYWDNNLTYDFNMDYLINYNLSCGLGYKKIYDFEEFYFTFRYLICY